MTDIPYDSHEPEPFVHETNLSLTPTALKIMKFYRPGSKDMTLINTNIDFVMFFHPESNKFLQGSCASGHDDVDHFASLVVKKNKWSAKSISSPRGSHFGSPRKSIFAIDKSDGNENPENDEEDGEEEELGEEAADESNYLQLHPTGSTYDLPPPPLTLISDIRFPFFSPLVHPTPSNPVNLSAKSMFIFEYKVSLSEL